MMISLASPSRAYNIGGMDICASESGTGLKEIVRRGIFRSIRSETGTECRD